MADKYKGIVIEESLENRGILDSLEVLQKPREDTPSDKWHLYTVRVSHDEIVKLQEVLKQGWYMHFCKKRDVVVVYRDKVFEINFDDKNTWKDAVEYGRSLGVPAEQLTFPID
jgi:hypothetical protein|tara:strand:- start:43028 stop:43366 length:339 start_codon:yes stop_codon:yes gene_type:complete